MSKIQLLIEISEANELMFEWIHTYQKEYPMKELTDLIMIDTLVHHYAINKKILDFYKKRLTKENKIDTNL